MLTLQVDGKLYLAPLETIDIKVGLSLSNLNACLVVVDSQFSLVDRKRLILVAGQVSISATCYWRQIGLIKAL